MWSVTDQSTKHLETAPPLIKDFGSADEEIPDLALKYAVHQVANAKAEGGGSAKTRHEFSPH